MNKSEAESHEQANRVSHPIYNLLPPNSRGSIPWRNSPLICIGRGLMPPTKCGGSLIPNCGRSRIIPGASCKTVSRDQIERVLDDPVFRKNVDEVVEASRQAARAPA